MNETLRSKKWVDFAIGVISFVSLAFFGWATYFRVIQPYDGLDWTVLTGEVYAVAMDSPADGILLPGDIILSWDGASTKEAGSFYYGKSSGDSMELFIRRGDREFQTQLTVGKAPLSILIRRMLPSIVALAFWTICVVTLAFGQKRKHARGLCLWCLGICGILVSGSYSSTGPLWVSGIFNILIWFIGAITIHLYKLLPGQGISRIAKALICVAYGISFSGSLPILLIGVSDLRAAAWMGTYYTLQRAYLATCLIVALALLVKAYRRTDTREARLKIHIITMSNGLALLPIVALNILPDCLFHRTLIPWEFGLLFLLIIPVGYGYAIVRHQIVKFDDYIHRGAIYSIVFSVLVSIYLGLAAAINVLLPSRVRDSLLVDTLILVSMSLLFMLMRDSVLRFSDQIFFGGYYDYQLAVERISEGLKTIDDIGALMQTVARRILETVHLEHVCILTLQPDELHCSSRKGTCVTEQILQLGMVDLPSLLPEPGALTRFLQRTTNPLEIAELRERLSDIQLTEGERAILSVPENNVIVSIPGWNCLLGVIFVGKRLREDSLGKVDVDIFRAITRQFSVKLQSIRLLGELERRAAEAERLHQELIRAREEERMQLARELHDDVIQELVALNYRIAQLGGEEGDWICAEIRKIILSIRQVCRRLRPPTLEHLGLVAAIRSRLREFREECDGSMEVVFHADDDDFEGLREDVGICLYRVLCEALNNIRKHAQANCVKVELGMDHDEVSMVVRDNGEGFVVPQNLGQFIRDGHYGLAGIRERVEQVHGSFEIGSNINEGTRIACRVPLTAQYDGSGNSTEG
jgi:signal transduction histidine kinase